MDKLEEVRKKIINAVTNMSLSDSDTDSQETHNVTKPTANKTTTDAVTLEVLKNV